MLKKAVQQGRSERRPEAYPLGYVEGLSDARTKLADFFSILLGASAFRTKGGFFCCLTFFGGQGEELFALPAGTNFKVCGALIIDLGG